MSNHIKIFSGSANRALATKIAARVGVPLSAATLGRFPDGEIYVTFEETVRGRDVFLVQPTALQPNEYLMELFLMADAARRASAQRVTAVIPFFSYARQDRKERSRVPISAKLMANLLVAAGVNRVLTVDLHSPQIQVRAFSIFRWIICMPRRCWCVICGSRRHRIAAWWWPQTRGA